MAGHSGTARIVRIFVSSPGDVAAERRALQDVVDGINRTQARHHGVELVLHAWERDVVPRIGRSPQAVVDEQTPPYDIYVGIMWGRFGTPTEKHGSGTEDEFRQAAARWEATGEPWIIFYFRDDSPNVRNAEQAKQFTKVFEFREELQRRGGIVGSYTGVDSGRESFARKADEHLRLLLVDRFSQPVGGSRQRGIGIARNGKASDADPTAYLRDLLERTAYIEIRGLATGAAKAHRFPIDDLFVTLRTVGPRGDTRERQEPPTPEMLEGDAAHLRAAVPLETVLASRTVVVLGDPGSGKSTFLHRVAQGLAKALLGIDPQAARSLGLEKTVFPILIRADDLARYVAERLETRGTSKPATRHSARWLPRFLASRSTEAGWGLQQRFFQDTLAAGACVVLIDGLDEAPDRVARQDASRLIEEIAATYRGCTVVVTSRPAAYSGDVVLSSFAHAQIEPFDDAAIRTFLDRWCEALYRGQPGQAASHRAELEAAVTGPAQIRRLARNPVMLTALAVLQWNEKRLPEQRAELYESILTWLSRAREKRPGRLPADRCLTVLARLALNMQSGGAGERGRPKRRVQVPRRWAAEQIRHEFPARTSAEQIQLAERFLRDEELDSGIIIGRGNELRFWHLTFQEFLTARTIAGRGEAEQRKLLIAAGSRLYQPEWREVVLLFAGLLAGQGPPKVDGFVKAVLNTTKADGTLASQSRCVGLLGAIVRDLAPLGYQIGDKRYVRLLDAVLGIFDLRRSARIPIDVRVEAAEALGQAGDPRLDRKNPQRWVKIPAGVFLMGAQKTDPNGRNYDSEAFSDEGPVREVPVDGYEIARYPVTVAEFQAFVDDEAYQEAKWWTAGGFGQFDRPDHWDDQVQFPNRPVVGVSWFEASAFARWDGTRLATEAEWEKASRGTDGRKFPWGNEPADPTRLNYDGNVGRPTPVGLYPAGATPSGIYDLAGNVWEWCADDVGKGGRVVRGGSWYDDARLCRSAFRGRFLPVIRFDVVGFRVVVVGVARTR